MLENVCLAFIIYFPTGFSFFWWNTPPVSCLPSAECYIFSKLINHDIRIKTSACLHHIVLASVTTVAKRYSYMTWFITDCHVIVLWCNVYSDFIVGYVSLTSSNCVKKVMLDLKIFWFWSCEMRHDWLDMFTHHNASSDWMDIVKLHDNSDWIPFWLAAYCNRSIYTSTYSKIWAISASEWKNFRVRFLKFLVKKMGFVTTLNYSKKFKLII
jgi:hypothetical protein